MKSNVQIMCFKVKNRQLLFLRTCVHIYLRNGVGFRRSLYEDAMALVCSVLKQLHLLYHFKLVFLSKLHNPSTLQ